jgi:hypothetical protein
VRDRKRRFDARGKTYRGVGQPGLAHRAGRNGQHVIELGGAQLTLSGMLQS